VASQHFFVTRESGDETGLASNAIRDGCSTLVVVGGDGTCGKVAAAILESGASCRLLVVPAGTGNDFAKTLGLANLSTDAIANLAQTGNTVRIDVGRADGQYFLNSCGFGFDASVLEASYDVRFLKGNAVYIYSALKQLFTYRGINVSSSARPAVKPEKMLMVTVSNGRWLGGAFRIAPRASVLDGKLDVCFVADANVVNRARLFLAAMKGRHIGMAGVSAAAMQRLELSFDFNPRMEVDGELRIATSRTVELKCVPRALAVIAAPGALV
jgi:YegS/Rv2252/BmrU family lipid kinase